MRRVHERIPFRLIKTPCCGHLLCWVNPRSPNYCPECGSNIFSTVKASVIGADDEAMLSINESLVRLPYNPDHVVSDA